MAETLDQSVAIRVTFEAYLSSDHLSPATGKTIAVTISKNGAAFGNPSAGATNATEIASGSYYVDFSATDTGTVGPVVLMGTASGVDVVKAHYRVRAIPDTPGTTTLLSRIAAALTITGGKVDVNDKTGFSLAVTPPTAAQVRAEMDSNSTKLANLDVVLSTRLASSGYTVPPTVTQIRTEMDSNSTKLANLDATVSSRLASGSYTAPPSASSIRSEIDSNSTKLDVAVSTRLASGSYTSPPSAASIRSEIDTNSTKLDVAVSTRLAAADYTAPGTAPTVTQIRQEMDTNSTKLANLDTTVSSRLSSGSYTSPPSAASIRSEIDSNSTKLDVAVSTRLASGSYTAPDNSSITAIKAKTDNLPTDPADASDIAAAFGTVNTALGTIAGYIDTEVSAIKAKTDNLPASPAAVSNIPTAAEIRSEIDSNSTKLDVAVSTRLASGSYTAPPTVSQNADALFDQVDGVEAGFTLREATRIMLSAAGGKLSGAGTTNVLIRDVNDTKDRIDATVDADGNREAVTLDAS